jgi:hypothetical protein
MVLGAFSVEEESLLIRTSLGWLSASKLAKNEPEKLRQISCSWYLGRSGHLSHWLIWHGRRRCYAGIGLPELRTWFDLSKLGKFGQILRLSDACAPEKVVLRIGHTEEAFAARAGRARQMFPLCPKQFSMSQNPRRKVGVVFGVANKRSIAWAMLG